MQNLNITVSQNQQIDNQNESSNFLSDGILNPTFLIYFALAIVILILKGAGGQGHNRSRDAKFATPADIARGRRIGLKQIEKQKLGRAAFQLENLVLSDVQPAIAVVGKSGTGKTRSVVDPAIKSAIDQGWTNLVFDVKGEFAAKHAPYALSKGYQVYQYSPGSIGDGLNLLEFMKDANDAKGAEEIASVLEANFGKPGENKDGFFSPQGVALLKLVFMMAKASSYPDLLTAWKFLSLPDLANRIKAAYHYDCFQELGMNCWIREAGAALRTMAKSDRTVEGIIGTSMTNFIRLIDPSIIPSLINHTIPLDLKGKQIVFLQLDEQAKSATSPLVAAAIHMFVIRNLNAQVKRKTSFGLFLDEFDSISLPEIKDYITKMRTYGLVAMLSYQSNSQVNYRYTPAYADSVLSSCGTKIYFDTGHHDTAKKVSEALGTTTVKEYTNSRSYGGKTTRTRNEQNLKEPLMKPEEINKQETGVATIVASPGFKKRPHHTKIKIEKRNTELWETTYPEVWRTQIKPYREKMIKTLAVNSPIAIKNREVIADCLLPSVLEIKVGAQAA